MSFLPNSHPLLLSIVLKIRNTRLPSFVGATFHLDLSLLSSSLPQLKMSQPVLVYRRFVRQYSLSQVRFANRYDILFLVSTKGHGTTSRLREINDGLLIKLTNFRHVEVEEDGQSAWVGAGVDNHQVVRDLYAQSKVTSNVIQAQFRAQLTFGSNTSVWVPIPDWSWPWRRIRQVSGPFGDGAGQHH